MLTESSEAAERIGQNIRRRAYHEAGHAVLAHRFGIPVYEVSIVPDGDSSGHVHAGPLSSARAGRELDAGEVSPASLEEIELRCVSILSGEEAQFRVDSEGGEEWRRIRAQSENSMDDDALTRLLMRLHRDRQVVAQHRAELLVRTVALLDTPEVWGTVEDVANALLERSTLTADEVRVLVERARQRHSREGR